MECPWNYMEITVVDGFLRDGFPWNFTANTQCNLFPWNSMGICYFSMENLEMGFKLMRNHIRRCHISISFLLNSRFGSNKCHSQSISKYIFSY